MSPSTMNWEKPVHHIFTSWPKLLSPCALLHGKPLSEAVLQHCSYTNPWTLSWLLSRFCTKNGLPDSQRRFPGDADVDPGYEEYGHYTAQGKHDHLQLCRDAIKNGANKSELFDNHLRAMKQGYITFTDVLDETRVERFLSKRRCTSFWSFVRDFMD